MIRKILKSTERGQITLPKQWRERFETDSYFIEMHEDRMVIVPFRLDEIAGEEVLFDADRDNDGQGVSPDAIIEALKQLQNG